MKTLFDEILGGYTEGSKVRADVLSLIQRNKFDVLHEECSALTDALFVRKPDPETVASSLAMFIGDLPPAPAVSMVVNMWGIKVGESTAHRTYAETLCEVLEGYEGYRQVFTKAKEALKRAQEAKKG